MLRVAWNETFTTSLSLLIVILIYKSEWIAISDFDYWRTYYSPDCTSWEVVCCLFSLSFFTFLSKEMISNLTIVNSNSNQSEEKYSQSLFGIGKRAIVHSFKVHWWIKHNNLTLGVSVVQYHRYITYFTICGTFLKNSEHRGQQCVRITRTRGRHHVFLHIQRTKNLETVETVKKKKNKKTESLEIYFVLRAFSLFELTWDQAQF